MSSITVFAFVEGKDLDPFFYGKLCESVCEKHNVRYEIQTANKIPPHAGGKFALLKFHDFLRKRKALETTLGGKRTLAVFFLDKDVDDISKHLRRSRHIIYTRFYDSYNDVFLNGDLARAAATAASLDQVQLMPLLSNPNQWCRKAAQMWQDWIVLCVLVTVNDIRYQCNYRVMSRIQCPVTGNVNNTKLTAMKRNMATFLRMAYPDFEELFQTVRKRIQKLYAAGHQDKVFKGKWYPIILAEDVKRFMGKVEYVKDSFAKKVSSAIVATLCFSEDWTQYYCKRLSDLLDN